MVLSTPLFLGKGAGKSSLCSCGLISWVSSVAAVAGKALRDGGTKTSDGLSVVSIIVCSSGV